MSTLTVATLPRISASTLSCLLLAGQSSNLDACAPPPSLAIIDVRDDDYIGGHIKHSMHVPSATLGHKVPELVRKLKDKETVVFHCALSQMRGPGAALRYLRERERLLGPAPKGGQDAQTKEDGEAEGQTETAPGAEIENSEVKEQKVYVLDDGFVGWVQQYAEDSRLTEGYRKEIWKNDYSY